MQVKLDNVRNCGLYTNSVRMAYFNSERLLLTRFVVFFFLGISYLYGIAVQADALHSSLDMKLTPLFVASAAINIKPS